MNDYEHITPDAVVPLRDPDGDIVSLADIKAHIRATGNADDTYLEKLQRVAARGIEGALHRPVRPLALECRFHERLPDDKWFFQIWDETPVRSVTSVKYYDSDGMEQTAPATWYDIENTWTLEAPPSVPLTIRPTDEWEDGAAVVDRFRPIKIEVESGWDTIPEAIQTAAKILIADAFVNRRSSVSVQQYASGQGVSALLEPYSRSPLITGW